MHQFGSSRNEVGDDDYYLDLLFFHVEQLRYFVVELKTGKFQPEFAGKLNFYVALVDDQLKRPAHSATVGILICGSKNEHSVRYSLSRSGPRWRYLPIPTMLCRSLRNRLCPAKMSFLPRSNRSRAQASLRPDFASFRLLKGSNEFERGLFSGN